MTTCYSFRTPQFTPAARIISAITQAEKAQITTTVEHLYKDGIKVRIEIPRPRGRPFFGMQQIEGQIGTVEVVDATNFTVTIDSRSYDPFSIPGVLPDTFTCPQCVPVAEVNEIVSEAVANTSGRRKNALL